MSKVKKAGSTLSQATMKNNIRGDKYVEFYIESNGDLLNLHMLRDDNKYDNRVIESKSNDPLGNAVAMAMDILTNTSLPIGTKFEVKIEFEMPQ